MVSGTLRTVGTDIDIHIDKVNQYWEEGFIILIQISSTNNVSLVRFPLVLSLNAEEKFCWTFRKNLELIQLSSISTVSLGFLL